tara:strand:+ start:477 stop:704 length:228 start_codon:yes stop_codon:yes gene_type:complete
MNLHAMEAPAMTELQIAQWCRMSLRVLMIYLKHNRTGPDATNRTDAITGVSSLTFQVRVIRLGAESERRGVGGEG